MNKENKPIISTIIIALNEEKSLPRLLDNLAKQTYDHSLIDVILVDSLSKDNTASIMNNFKLSSDFKRVLCLKNPNIIQATGWNIALKHVIGDVIIRLDAHASIPSDFFEKNILCLADGHDICGGKVTNFIHKQTKWSSTVNTAENSMFGGSIAKFRHKSKAGIVDTLAFACYKKTVFDKVGMFNENLLRTEDNEMHYRMRKAGYKFWYDPRIISCRETRATFVKLLHQKYLNGFWIGYTLGICPQCISIYHLLPFTLILSIICSIICFLFGFSQPLIILAALYFLTNLIMTIIAVIVTATRNLSFICLPILFLLLHLGYGIGTILGINKIIIEKHLKRKKLLY